MTTSDERPDPPDRTTILAAVMPALLAAQLPPVPPEADATGTDTVVAQAACVLAGVPVAREAFSRLGVRCRAVVDEGAPVVAGEVVAELGGPVEAIRRAAPVALTFLGRLSAVASGATAADDDELERYAAVLGRDRLSPSFAVDDDGPSFRLGSEG